MSLNYQISADRLDDLDRQCEEAERQYLRERGWNYECSYPGSYWLWSREIPDSGVKGVVWKKGMFTMNTAIAIRTQRAMDSWFNPDPEE